MFMKIWLLVVFIVVFWFDVKVLMMVWCKLLGCWLIVLFDKNCVYLVLSIVVVIYGV